MPLCRARKHRVQSMLSQRRGIIQVAALWVLCRHRHKTHSVGHPRRLNRFTQAEGDRIEKYSFEELIAEFGAAFLCGFAGIQNPDTDSLQVGYIQGWLTALRNDSRMVVRAASAAQRAADYVRGKLTNENATQTGELDCASAQS